VELAALVGAGGVDFVRVVDRNLKDSTQDAFETGLMAGGVAVAIVQKSLFNPCHNS